MTIPVFASKFHDKIQNGFKIKITCRKVRIKWYMINLVKVIKTLGP